MADAPLKSSPWRSLGAALLLAAGGAAAALPFFNRGLVGTGEAFNYSLSVEDALLQMRAGIVPPLVGQTQYAFNGRIHPLRNAPLLHYYCAAIDLATGRRLPFWEVQNISLAASLIAAAFACYLGIRWATRCSRPVALLAALVYDLSPPLLGAAHTLDLFMTVHAAVFVPLAIAAAVQSVRNPSYRVTTGLAAALAGAWLAHPPVACWLTAVSILIAAFGIVARRRPSDIAGALGGCLLFGALAGFVFVSAETLSSGLAYFDAGPDVWAGFPGIIVSSLKGAFPGMLLPVSPDGGKLSDLQPGYGALVLLLGAGALIIRGRRLQRRGGGALAACACILAALILILLDLPVPGITGWLWAHVPHQVLTVTTEWPMQRLWLLVVALAGFAAGLATASMPAPGKRARLAAWAAGIAILGWSAHEARPFLKRGIANRWTLAMTKSALRPSNLDLTITSYAFTGAPPNFSHGVLDPLFQFRILSNGAEEVASPLAAARKDAPVVATGDLRFSRGAIPKKIAASVPLVLKPGHTYLLSFAFRSAPTKAFLQVQGPLLSRTYTLPEAGEAKGFGMLDGQQRSIPLWTDSPQPESVVVAVSPQDGAPRSGAADDFADYTLQDVDLSRLPVRLEGLVPLRFTVDAPAGCTVETPRRYLSGYAATVGGMPATPLLSPYRQVMVPVPPGRSSVVLSYPGPESARVAFWLCTGSWGILLAWLLAGAPRLVPVGLPLRALRRYGLPAAAVIAAAALAAWVTVKRHRERARAEAALAAAGPARVDFMLPYRKLDVSEPILATGKAGKGVVVFVHYSDPTHIIVGADVWGSLFQSGLIETDYSHRQSIVVSDGALLPLDNPKVAALSPTERSALRGRIEVELNGRRVISQAADTYESTPEQVQVGRTDFGSLTAPEFSGRVIGWRRLPIPRSLMLASSRSARLRFRLDPADPPSVQPLLAANAAPDSFLCVVAPSKTGAPELEVRGPGGSATPVAARPFDPTKEHELVLSADSHAGGSGGFRLSLDGAGLPGSPMGAQFGRVPMLLAGLDPGGLGACAPRFSGLTMDLTEEASPGWIPQNPGGAEEIVLTFPAGLQGRHQPILTSGKTGAGDFIYVVFEDAGHVRLGFDHWNGAAVVSDPIAVDYSVPHEIWIRSGPLLGALNTGHSGVRVLLDGRPAVVSGTEAYASAPSDITVGANRIGGSSADAEFTGVIHFAGRVSPEAIRW